ncbi:MAG: serine/threonine-protein phosphatase [Candidatus Sericytochromatia bacterium]|nr:serine/threonine-protein phosphatase [Candidatus Tanganyikabacteria bacterium]
MGTRPFFSQTPPRLRFGWRYGLAIGLAAILVALIYAGSRAVLAVESAMPLAPALATALCAAIAAPTLRGVLRLVAGRSHGSESLALTQLAAVTQSADSAGAIGEAFCQVAREALKLPEVAVYIRKGDRLIGVAGDIPEALREQGVALAEVRPRSQPGTRLLSPSELPGVAASGQRGWVVLESNKDVLGAISIGSLPGGWGLAGRDHRLLQALCRDLAQSLRSVEIFGEFAAIEGLARDLEIGREVQAGFLSRPAPALKGVQVSARSRPARENGGDFFDLLEVEGGRVGLLVGDATGRGISAALHMAMTLSFFRSLVPGASSPRQVLEQINNLICRYRASGKTFVSACYGIYDCRDKTLTIANAGMPPPVLNGRPLELKGLPLGARANVRFREEKFPLTSGDVLVLMSDGINSVRPGGRKLGWDRVFRLVGDHTALSAEGLIDQMLRSCSDWVGGALTDDATLICLKIGEGGTRLVKGPAARHTRKLSGAVLLDKPDRAH